jgi:hypothetical protein
MGKIADAVFTGASGDTYLFDVYTLDTSFNNIGAVYIFSRRKVEGGDKGTHKVLYIGSAKELKDRIAYHEGWQCLERYGVNCICVHPEKNESARLTKEGDLIRAIQTPCNEQ